MSDELKALFAEQFSRVNKQEKHISSEKERLEAMRRELEEARQDALRYRELKNRNPFEILEAFGVTYDKLLEADQERRKPIDPYVKEQSRQIAELRDLLMTQKREQEAEAMARREKALIASIRDTVATRGFDVIEKLGLHNEVKEYMAAEYEQKGEVPSFEDACKAVTRAVVTKYSSIKDSKWLSGDFEEAAATPVATAKESVKPDKTTKPVDDTPDNEIMRILEGKKAMRHAPVEKPLVVAPEPKAQTPTAPVAAFTDDTLSRQDKLKMLAMSLPK